MRVCPPPHNQCQLGMTKPVCGGVEAYPYQPSLCVTCKYRSQGVQISFYQSTPSTKGPLGNEISQGSTENPGNAGANIPDASNERNQRDTSGYSRFLFECIPHFHMHTISSMLNTVERGD